MRELARQHGPEAIARLVVLMRSKDTKVAIRAAEALLDRGYGRPAQAVEVSGGDETPVSRNITVTFVSPKARSGGDANLLQSGELAGGRTQVLA